MREIRNLFAHDYPESEQERADALNLAFENASELLIILYRTYEYMIRKLGLKPIQWSIEITTDARQ